MNNRSVEDFIKTLDNYKVTFQTSSEDLMYEGMYQWHVVKFKDIEENYDKQIKLMFNNISH